jgi:hypothetical protein
MNPPRRLFVHLAYVDDSDTKAKRHKWQVMAGIVVEDYQFPTLEIALGIVREDLIPADRIDEFEEFHAAELYGGYGIFKDIDQEKRFEAIRRLLMRLGKASASVIYGAVDLAELQRKVYASAEPLDIAFRACIQGVRKCVNKAIHNSVDFAIAGIEDPDAKAQAHEDAFKEGFVSQFAILIVDDFPDRKTKELLSKSFRSLRGGELSHFHDDMYFGDSRYSIGIQLADLCSYFIARHLDGDAEIEPFYEMIEPYLAFSETHPPEEPKQLNNLTTLSALSGGKGAPNDK